MSVFVNRDNVNKKKFKRFLEADPRKDFNVGNNEQRTIAKKIYLKDFVKTFKDTYERAPTLKEILYIARSSEGISKKYLKEGKDYLTKNEMINLRNQDPNIFLKKQETRLSKPPEYLSFFQKGPREGPFESVPRFVNKKQEESYIKDLKEKYKNYKGRSSITNEYLSKKYLPKNINPAQAKNIITAVNNSLVKKLDLEFPERKLDEIGQQRRDAQASRRKNISSTSSLYKEDLIKKMKKGTNIDLAHRSSLNQNKTLGLDYLSTNLGLEAPIINQEIIIPTEQKLENLYKKQTALIRQAKKFDKVPSNISKQLEQLNIKISDVVDRTGGRLQGILVDELNLEAIPYGKDYSKSLGYGVVDKPVKELTKYDLGLIEKNLPQQIKSEQKLSQKILSKMGKGKIGAAAVIGSLIPGIAFSKNTQTAMQDQVVEGQAPEPKLAEQIKYDSYAGFVKQDDPNVKASQSDVLYWIADNEIPEEVADIGKMVGQVGATIGGATVALGLPDVKKTIEERKAIGKSPITGTLAKGFYRLGSPLATAAFTAPQILDEETTTKDIVTDPLNYLGLATMETLGKRAGTIAAPTAARAPGILGFAKDFGSLKNVGEAIPGKLSTALRLGLSPRVIAGASRFLGIPGLVASGAYSLYDYLSNKESE
jgi:hypothetical protein